MNLNHELGASRWKRQINMCVHTRVCVNVGVNGPQVGFLLVVLS